MKFPKVCISCKQLQKTAVLVGTADEVSQSSHGPANLQTVGGGYIRSKGGFVEKKYRLIYFVWRCKEINLILLS